MLIIGNKPFEKLKINRLLDGFENNTRCNMGIPNGNNGSIKDRLAVCNHIYEYFVTSSRSWEFINNTYKNEYHKEYLEYFYNNFSVKDYNLVWYANADNVRNKYNSMLKTMGCPYIFSNQPRTGMVCIFETLSVDICPFIFGFSVTDETRKTYYVKDHIFEKENRGTSCHNKNDELNILRWLHINNYLDATFCMLEDIVDSTIRLNGLEPTETSIKTIEYTYGSLEIVK